MAENFTFLDPVRCAHYAHFASHLDRKHFDMIYWVLFLLVLFMLFISSWYWAKCNDAVEKYSAHSPQHRSHMRRCLFVCGLCFFIAATANVMEVYVLMALQFCDGEDLISLYWSTWTTLQLGSCIAIAGIALSVVHSFRGRKHPPWGLALGTPVLVIAGFAHFVHHALRRRVIASKDREGSKDTLPISQAVTQNTLVNEDDYNDSDNNDDHEDGVQKTSKKPRNEFGWVVGFGHDGGPILLLEEKPRPMSPCATLLGKDDDGRYIVAYQQGSAMVDVRTRGNSDNGPGSSVEPVAAGAEPRQDPGGTGGGSEGGGGGGEASGSGERDLEKGGSA